MSRLNMEFDAAGKAGLVATAVDADCDDGSVLNARLVRRPALVYGKPAHGATVIAEVLVRQRVMAVFEQRQWVEVEYFDWHAQQKRQGWLLKKYTTRLARKVASNKGGDAMRRYRQRLSSAMTESEADIKAGRYTKETVEEHMRWLESVL